MDIKNLFSHVGVNAETMLLTSALSLTTGAKLNLQHLDGDAMAIALFAVATQLEAEHPGLAEKYGWQRVAA
jgi:PBP1b-binding outer membrane lipoprotein LpoB